MKPGIPFRKMHGLGNDFVVVASDELTPDVKNERARALLQSIAPRLLSRTRGIGGDGILLVSDIDERRRRARMSIVNRDGSTAGMCGNGARCVVHYLAQRWGEEIPAGPVVLDVGERTVQCSVRSSKGYAEVDVSVCMGRPEYRRTMIPMMIPMAVAGGPSSEEWIEYPVVLKDGTRVIGTGVSMGNPHFIISDRPYTPAERDRLAPLLEHAEIFPDRTNVSFVRVHSEHSFDLVVWERGVGYTEACGSAACAAFAALRRTNKVSPRANVTLPGGVLEIALDDEAHVNGSLVMTGPSVHVFDGSFSPDEFTQGR